jgi:hypothetical protein
MLDFSWLLHFLMCLEKERVAALQGCEFRTCILGMGMEYDTVISIGTVQYFFECVRVGCLCSRQNTTNTKSNDYISDIQ